MLRYTFTLSESHELWTPTLRKIDGQIFGVSLWLADLAYKVNFRPHKITLFQNTR